MLEHGGRLIEAAIKYNIPKVQWLDLSTGINPNGWPICKIPNECWQRLPESEDGLMDAAKGYYQCHSVLPVAGTQAAIQALPLIRKKSRVGVLVPAYAEHAHSWEKAGHQVIGISEEEIDYKLSQLEILIIINPNNPTGQCFSKERLLDWHMKLSQRGGWLIVDEAFIDTTAELGLSGYPVQEGLIILRSIGKFFGLAGIRCGFVIAPDSILYELNEKLGPWSISHPSRYVATAALIDREWQARTRAELKIQAARMSLLLNNRGLKVAAKTDLFHWVRTSRAKKVYQALACRGILTRLFSKPESLRLGLPKDEPQWLYLDSVLKEIYADLK